MSDTHHFYISSTDREDYANTSPANFRVSLHQEINASCCELSFALIPNTYYNITSRNNAFNINATLYTVSPGCYTLNDLLQEIANILNALTPAITYNDITNKITLACAGVFIMDLTISNSIARTLGFKEQVYNGAATYTTTYAPKLYETCIFVEMNIGQGVLTTNSNMRNASFVIPSNVNKSEVIQFYSKTQFSISPKIKQNGIQFLDIKVLDDKGYALEGLSDWSMMIKIR